jgi:hypothetical protein
MGLIFGFLIALAAIGGGRLARQVRYRNPATNAIVQVDASVPVKRKRLKS